MVLTNVTGWQNLTDGNIVAAVFNAYNEPWGGYLILLIYITISAVIYLRTNSIELCTIISFIFLGVFLVSPWFSTKAMGIAIIITAFELGTTLYRFFAGYR
jgi:hypothetical protein